MVCETCGGRIMSGHIIELRRKGAGYDIPRARFCDPFCLSRYWDTSEDTVGATPSGRLLDAPAQG
jgi:hypothetical protein